MSNRINETEIELRGRVQGGYGDYGEPYLHVDGRDVQELALENFGNGDESFTLSDATVIIRSNE